eukprot:GILK01004435.1.p1 GENE.GILK01004435.1~~GILK01004435.1.p1  ORF type:complete len:737 (-),score=157.65 GILK01004435.1:66-2276(-)
MGKRRAPRGGKKKKEAEYHTEVIESEWFKEYYQKQGIVTEEEWPLFLKSLLKPLPATFRINGNLPFAAKIRDRLLSDEMHVDAQADASNDEWSPPSVIPWYPDQFGWKLDASRQSLRSIPQLAKVHAFLVRESERGHISRQEAVSMIPPLFLNVQPSHKVLDMCAAPGSKTSQLLEALYAEEAATQRPPTGFVVANDADAKRANMLVHQLKRLNTPGFIVSHHDAQFFPSLHLPPSLAPVTTTVETDPNDQGLFPRILFDRILADVPCSGDGTLRKNPSLWRRWTPAQALGLHRIQTLIIVRAASLLEVGGLMVYSTCSFNPIENEAVVAELLRRSEGSMELVDASGLLPELIRRPGLTDWSVQGRDENRTWLHSADEIPANRTRQLRASMFAPSAEELSRMHLHRCMRLLPQDQDSGGFFVALLRKVAKLPASALRESTQPPQTQTVGKPVPEGEMTEAQSIQPEEADEPMQIPDAVEEEVEGEEDGVTAEVEPLEGAGASAGKRKLETAVSSEPTVKKARTVEDDEDETDSYDRFKFVSPDDPVWQRAIEFYGIRPDFPANQLVTRSKTSKRLLLVSSGVRQIILADTTSAKSKLRVINMGVKVLERKELSGVSYPHRICQDGVLLMLPYLTKRVVHCPPADFSLFLKLHSLKTEQFPSEQVRAELNSLETGALIMQLQHPSYTRPVAVVAHKHFQTVAVMVSKHEIRGLIDMISEDDPELASTLEATGETVSQ